MKRLRCVQCEFLKFKNIDEWRNHCIGHWRLGGMKGIKVQGLILKRGKGRYRGNNKDSARQCCGSGSGRIRIIWQDTDPHSAL